MEILVGGDNLLSKKAIIILLLTTIISTVVGAKIIIDQFTYTTSGSLGDEAHALVIFINGTQIEGNGTFTYGKFIRGINTYNLTVWNNGSTTVLVYLKTSGLPVGWTQTWEGNNTLLMPDYVVEGVCTITIPVEAVDGMYSWMTTVTAEKPP